MNLNELRNQAYRNAVVHGWHEENLSDEHFLCLVMSELMEAVNADRKGKRALRKIFEQPATHRNHILNNIGYSASISSSRTVLKMNLPMLVSVCWIWPD